MRRLTRLYALPLLFGAIVVGLALVSASVSCSSAPVMIPTRVPSPAAAPQAAPPSAPQPAAQPVAQDSVPVVPITVQNQTFYDVDVWLLANDAKVRHLGIVSGYTETHFLVRGWYLGSGQQLALYAKARVTDQEYNSPGIAIFAGRGIKWLIERPGVEWLTSYQLPAWT